MVSLEMLLLCVSVIVCMMLLVRVWRNEVVVLCDIRRTWYAVVSLSATVRLSAGYTVLM